MVSRNENFSPLLTIINPIYTLIENICLTSLARHIIFVSELIMNRNKDKEMEKKMIYVPPTIVVTRVVLEGNIAAISVNKKIDVESWVNDPEPNVNTNDDIWVNF